MYVTKAEFIHFSPDMFRAINSQHFEQQYGEVDDGVDGHLDFKREYDVQFHPDQLVQDNLFEEAKEAKRHILSQPEHFRAQSPSFPKFLPEPTPVRSTSPMALNTPFSTSLIPEDHHATTITTTPKAEGQIHRPPPNHQHDL